MESIKGEFDRMKRCTMEFVNDFGSTYKVERIHSEESITFDDYLEVGEMVNELMKLAGFYYNKQMVFMESVDEDEADFLLECLHEYRRGKEGAVNA